MNVGELWRVVGWEEKNLTRHAKLNDEDAAVVSVERELLAAAREGNDGGVLEEMSGRNGGERGGWGGGGGRIH